MVIGATRGELGGSEYHKAVHGVVQGEPPKVFLEEEFMVANQVLRLIKEDDAGNISAVHDCSTGGLAVTLSEMAISGGRGAVINLSQIPGAENGLKITELLFSESHGRYVLTVGKEAVNDVLNKINVPAGIIGEVRGKSLTLKDGSLKIPISLPLSKIKKTYHGVIEKFMA